MQRGTEIIEAKAKINSRSSAESNNNVPEQGDTDSRRGEVERASHPLHPSSKSATLSTGWGIMLQSAGMLQHPGMGMAQGFGALQVSALRDTKIPGRDQRCCGICSAGRAGLPGSQMSQPRGRLTNSWTTNSWMVLHLEHPHPWAPDSGGV